MDQKKRGEEVLSQDIFESTRLRSSIHLDRIMGLVAAITITAAWFIGFNGNKVNLEPHLKQVLPKASHFDHTDSNVYAAFFPDSQRLPLSYVGSWDSGGYGGPVRVIVAVNTEGKVAGLKVVKHRETPSWYQQVEKSRYLSSFLDKSYLDPFEIGKDIDGVSGATYTSRAIAKSILKGSREIAVNSFGLPTPQDSGFRMQFSLLEIALTMLFAIGIIGRCKDFLFKKQIRWLSMLSGLTILGIVYNQSLTLVTINKFLMGFWPHWQTHLYQYLLLGGILFFLLIKDRNVYCRWLCPLGAAQECVGTIGKARVISINGYKGLLKWLRRGFVWLVIVLALVFRNPGMSNYEITGTLFDLMGSNRQFILLSTVLVAALFIKQPWCRYLCPIPPLEAYYRMIRKWGRDIWMKRKTITSRKSTC